MDELLNNILIQLERLKIELVQLDKRTASFSDLKTRIALLEDSIVDMEKNSARSEDIHTRYGQKNSALLICFITATAIIIAGILQGVLTGSFF